MFFLTYLNQNDNGRRYKTQRYYLPKGVIKNHNVIINGKNFYVQPIDSDMKRYKEIRKLTTGQCEDYTIDCLLDYGFIKNHYRLIAVGLSWQKELNADPKVIQHIESVGKLKNTDGLNVDGTESSFVLKT